MKFTCLASGSSGNCFYIENKEKAVLIDVGISAKQVLDRLASLNENPKKIKAVFVSHEHIDHIRGVDVLARTLNVPIFATKGTIKNSFLCSKESLINQIKSNERVDIAGLEVESIPKSHDAEEPVSFVLRNHRVLSVLTDIGLSCKNISNAVSESDALIMESNHDVALLQQGPYPYFLKKRILSDKGHLSNFSSAISVMEHAPSKLKSITLAHLSETNNTPRLALDTFSDLISQRRDLSPRIQLSNKISPTPLIEI